MDDRDSAVFPQEIFDLIIDDLGQQVESGLLEEREPSEKAIRACSGASRAFHRRARLYLAELKIDISEDPFPDSSCPTQRLLAALTSSIHFPGLGMVYYLQSVSLRLQYPLFRGSSKYSHLLQAVIPEVLDALHGPSHGISSFEIYSESLHGFSDWSHIDKRFTQAFHTMCCSPNMTTLCMSGFSGVPTCILLGTRIKTLEIVNITFSLKDDSAEYIYSSAISQAVQPSVLAISTYYDYTTLLSLLRGEPYPPVFAYLTDLTICLLEFLRIDHYYLAEMRRLRALRLIQHSHRQRDNHPVDEGVARFTTFLLKNANGDFPKSLRRLEMEANAALPTQFAPYKLNSGIWAQLDAFLSSEGLANMNRIRLRFHFRPARKHTSSNDGGLLSQSDQQKILDAFKYDVLKSLHQIVEARPAAFRLDISSTNK
ncbi:hypothetical protein CVT26_000459 [Gymnopilus dilepis]|uniref:Uncharacterized protein n=1 Tax=Gymnopilus dilepis TaxID=231916 RepID=A0A409Y2H1_9AGAR|nr:hypothetical protein CVT26_000459 [Gymnopilus dilepis]